MVLVGESGVRSMMAGVGVAVNATLIGEVTMMMLAQLPDKRAVTRSYLNGCLLQNSLGMSIYTLLMSRREDSRARGV